jgi:hypothetical protein
VSRASAGSKVTTLTSPSLKKEWALRFAEPSVSQRSSMIPTFACTYTRSLVLPERARIVVARNRP